MSSGINNHFGWVKQRSAYQDIEYHRAKRAEYAAQDQANLDAINNTMSSAMQNKISGLANLAGEAALKRVKAAAQAKIDATIKQVDDAQKLVGPAVSSKAVNTVV